MNKILVGISVISIIFIIFCYLKNYNIVKHFTVYNFINIILILGIIYFAYDYIYNYFYGPIITQKASMIGSKRYLKNITELPTLKEEDLLKIKDILKRCKI